MSLKEDLKELRNQITKLDFDYECLDPNEKENKFFNYDKERKELKEKIRHVMYEIKVEERNKENDKYQRR